MAGSSFLPQFFFYKGLKYAHGALGGDVACHDQQLVPCEISLSIYIYWKARLLVFCFSHTYKHHNSGSYILQHTRNLLARTTILNLQL